MTAWPQPDEGLSLEPVAEADFEAMVALRIRAMRPSLEALGRFDPERARQRLAEAFSPAHMRHIVRGGGRLGFATLKPLPAGTALELEHLYIEPGHQGRGIGAWVLGWATSRADHAGLPLLVEALKGSDANRFYRRHGFVQTGLGEWEVHYRREPRADPRDVVRHLWAAFQARDWRAARALMRDDLVVRWWSSGERFKGADAFVAVQAAYPEGWTLHLMALEMLDDGRVSAFVRVEHPPHGTFLVQQTARVRDGLLADADELWATAEPPPDWRTPARFPGLEALT